VFCLHSKFEFIRLRKDFLSYARSLNFYGAKSLGDDDVKACGTIKECRNLRRKYFGGANSTINEKVLKESFEPDKDSDLVFQMGKDGVMEVFQAEDTDKMYNLCIVPNVKEYDEDYENLVAMVNDGIMRSFCFKRLQLLSSAFRTHKTMNAAEESAVQGNLLGTDFYRTMKVDNHIHAAGAPSARTFVSFVTKKLETESDTIVRETPDGRKQTLGEVFKEAGLNKDNLTVDAFNVLADYSVYQRFDNFNSKYSPFHNGDLRKIFLKSENIMNGRYFAELLKIVLSRSEQSKGQVSAVELRLSIYGMKCNEWDELADFLLRDWEGGEFPGPLLSTKSNRWHIQIPRLWRIFKKSSANAAKGFDVMLKNIFIPMFEATLYPERNPKVAELLKHIVGIDSVDDEGSPEEPCSCCLPKDYTQKENPAYAWQLYFLWANLEVLNSLRKARGLNTIAFRPHAGETGNPLHLACTYMLAQSINHGINLSEQVSLQYLYYLDQIGLSISPLSNNFLFRKMRESPFLKFFRRGLNVTLSTDDPLIFHMSDDPLLEEYAVARATFDLSMTDMMEIARNSVMQSGFEDEYKKKHLGENYAKGVTHCDEEKTHVPLIRAKYRAEHLAQEHMYCAMLAAGEEKTEALLKEMRHQFGLVRDALRTTMFKAMDDVDPSFPELGQL